MCTVDGGAGEREAKARCGQAVPRLSVRDAHDGDRHTLAFSGELDLASRSLFDAAVARAVRADCSALILDLGEIDFMDSTGLHGVLKAKTACAREGRQFMLVRGSRQVQRLFELSGLLEELPFVETAVA
jgi:anti-sigma B factor antagonist